MIETVLDNQPNRTILNLENASDRTTMVRHKIISMAGPHYPSVIKFHRQEGLYSSIQ